MFTVAVSTLFMQTELVKFFEFYIGRHGKQYNIVIYFYMYFDRVSYKNGYEFLKHRCCNLPEYIAKRIPEQIC